MLMVYIIMWKVKELIVNYGEERILFKVISLGLYFLIRNNRNMLSL